jgi:triosephosphate isomerase
MSKIKKIPKTKYLIVANWKDSPETLTEAKKNFKIIKSKKISSKIIPVICPSVMHLNEIISGYSGKVVNFGVQNFSADTKNPHTGEISIDQIKNLNVRYAIVGHAERRALGEDNFAVAEKVSAAINNDIMPILCVGEVERDKRGEYLRTVEQQIVESLSKIKKADLDKIVIAYEPVWTIGKGNKSINTHEIHQMVIFVKKILVSKFDKKIAMNVPIIYGGSVDADNSWDILENAEVQGLLIGRASTNPYSFVDILNSVK